MKLRVRTALVRGSLVLAVGLSLTAPMSGQDHPAIHVYREVDGRALRAFVFVPEHGSDEPATGAVLLFHGGGWQSGSPEWAFETAKRFAELGLVAIAVEYRLSLDDVTPIDALADVCASFRWARNRAQDLHLDPDRVAGYGVSAGGHLVAATATVGCPTKDERTSMSAPNALLLWSPALNVTRDGWFRQLLRGRADPAEYSPSLHVAATTPPTSIVHGEKDTLTPLFGAQQFCDGLTGHGVLCELHAYPDVGHLLTRNLANQESDFDPDPDARADGIARHEEFLAKLGFVERADPSAGSASNDR